MLYVATHMPKNTNSSTSSNDYIEKIRKLVEDDPYLGQNDLDNDPVAMVLGHDRKGYVRGTGGGVSKTEGQSTRLSYRFTVLLVPEQSGLPKTYFLKDFKRKHIAFGHLNSDAPPKEDVYSIIVDEIFDRSAYLFEGDGKFKDIMLGDMINWPKESVQFIRI